MDNILKLLDAILIQMTSREIINFPHVDGHVKKKYFLQMYLQ